MTRKEKKISKFKRKFLERPDIKYRGPLSYRSLRIIAWVSLAVAQALLFISIVSKFSTYNPINPVVSQILSYVSSLSTPLFIIASFSLILSGQKKIQHFLLLYGLGFLGIGVGLCIFYARYVDGLFVKFGLTSEMVESSVGVFLKERVEINVFCDLFMFTLFFFFISYTPHKTNLFEGKRIYIFRFMSLLPTAYIITSYILRILGGTGRISLSFYFHPFMATKSPFVFLVFVIIALILKYRERIFLSFGATKAQYHDYLKTNRNSLSMSITMSVVIGIVAFLEALVVLAVLVYYLIVYQIDVEAIDDILSVYQFGQCISMIIAVPFILLYSYTRKHKNGNLDIFIPIIGIALIVLVYIENIYQFLASLIS